jgi:hypothetical protein
LSTILAGMPHERAAAGRIAAASEAVAGHRSLMTSLSLNKADVCYLAPCSHYRVKDQWQG